MRAQLAEPAAWDALALSAALFAALAAQLPLTVALLSAVPAEQLKSAHLKLVPSSDGPEAA
jgi:hypothetical protein